MKAHKYKLEIECSSPQMMELLRVAEEIGIYIDDFEDVYEGEWPDGPEPAVAARRKLKYEDLAEVGDIIRAYDWPTDPDREPSYIEGRVLKKGAGMPSEPSAKAYEIEVTKKVGEGKVIDKAVGRVMFTPYETDGEHRYTTHPRIELIKKWRHSPGFAVPKPRKNTWVCATCGTEYKVGHNVGVTNSVADRTQCIKCYNKGLPADLSGDKQVYYEVDDLKRKLAQFTGTQEYHKLSLTNMQFTDGMAALAEYAKAYWLMDIIASVQTEPSVRKVPFQLWGIETRPDNSATVSVRVDTGLPPVWSQEIEYTDFPKGKFEWYVVDNVALLKSEY